MKKFLSIIWQLPQCLLGRVLKCIYKPHITNEYKGITVVYSDKMHGGISLGDIIILSANYGTRVGNTLLHEYGHTRQSLYLGWLYLIIIGLPSLLWAAFYNGPELGYYKFYTEKWADKLGNVIRK